MLTYEEIRELRSLLRRYQGASVALDNVNDINIIPRRYVSEMGMIGHELREVHSSRWLGPL